MEDIINVIVYGTPYGVPGTTGPQGPVGPGSTLRGPTGPTGPTGSQGIQGDAGAKGNPGEQGDPGPQGLQGNTGATGANSTVPGPTGARGSTGSTGANGIAGTQYGCTSSTSIRLQVLSVGDTVSITVPKGLAYTPAQYLLIAHSLTLYFNANVTNYTEDILDVVIDRIVGSASSKTYWELNLAGAVGPQGNTGTNGNTGATGFQGPTGNTGTPGDLFSTTSGTSIYLSDKLPGSVVFLSVPTGLAYTPAQTVLAAVSITQYFNAQVVSYSPPGITLSMTGICGGGTGSNWKLNLEGAPGQQGDQGNPGIQGPTGSQGNTGNTGATGATGATGNPGNTGATGADSTVPGPTGPQGNTGNNGTNGTNGNTGATGATGNPGNTGATGSQGNTGADGISGPYVITFNGLTGAVTGVTTGTANNFVVLQSFSSGISAAGGTLSGIFGIPLPGVTFTNRSITGTIASLNINAGNNINIHSTAAQAKHTIKPTVLIQNDGQFIHNNVPLEVRGTTSQNTNLTNWTTVSGTVLSSIGFSGGFSGPASSFGGLLTANAGISSSGATFSGLISANAGISSSGASFSGNISAPNIINYINGLTGAVTLSAGNNMGITLSGNSIIFSSTGACGSCGPIILDDTVYITGVCNSSGIFINTTNDTLTLYGSNITKVGSGVSKTLPGIEITNQTNSINVYASNISFDGSVNDIEGNLVNQFNGLTGNVEGVGSVNQGAGILLSGSTGNVTITNSGVRQIIGTSTQITASPSTGTGNVTLSLPAAITGVNSVTSTDNTKSISLIHEGALVTSNLTLKDGAFSIGTSTQGVSTTAYGTVTVTGGNNLNVTGNYLGTIVRSFNGKTGALQGVCTAVAGFGISVSGATGNVTITNQGVRSIDAGFGMTGDIFLIAGSNITIGSCAANKEITISATGGSATSDGSAIISKLYPNLPANGLCAGDLISYNGTDRWVPTPRTYLSTPSIWQTVADNTNTYPSSRYVSGADPSITIDGSTGKGFVVGELVQISLFSDEGGAGITLNSGTWLLNYSMYYSRIGGSAGLFKGYFAGLTIINAPTFFTPHVSGDGDAMGFAMKIRGTTYNAYDGRGGPFGCGSCDPDPDQHGLGNNCSDICCPTGVDLYPIVCDTRDGEGFTYNGVYFDCLPI